MARALTAASARGATANQKGHGGTRGALTAFDETFVPRHGANGDFLSVVPTLGSAGLGGPRWVRASTRPHHLPRHDGGLHQRTDHLHKHVHRRLRRLLRRWWPRLLFLCVRHRHRLRRLRTSSKPVDTLSICIMRRLYIWACHTYIWDPESVGQ